MIWQNDYVLYDANKHMSDGKFGKGQSERLSIHKTETGGPLEIFHKLAKEHDASVKQATKNIKTVLENMYPKHEFRIRPTLHKSEINKRLNELDKRLGVELFVNGYIMPESGLLEIKDKSEKWRLLLIGEAKFQGKDIQHIEHGFRTDTVKQMGKFTMGAGNVVERGFKNIVEVQNYMMAERYFPYVLLCYGSNFLTEELVLDWPGDEKSSPQEVKLSPSDGSLNRIDRMSAANYGMGVNQNLCRNIILENGTKLQPMSMYVSHSAFSMKTIMEIFMTITETSIEVLTEEKQL
jgi:type II restriction enzyme